MTDRKFNTLSFEIPVTLTRWQHFKAIFRPPRVYHKFYWKTFPICGGTGMSDLRGYIVEPGSKLEKELNRLDKELNC